MNNEKRIKNKDLRIWIYSLFFILYSLFSAHAVSVVATISGVPITDADITERTKIMPPSLTNRAAALDAITDDILKIEYARQWKIDPSEEDVKEALAKSKKSGPQAEMAARADVAWQMMIVRALMPSINVSDADIAQEIADLERDRGLPLSITFVRLVNIPAAEYEKLITPVDCAAAGKMAKDLGGEPQKMTIVQYEMAPDVREKMTGLDILRWSPLADGKTYLICEKKKTSEWGKLDEIIKRNAVYKRALFQADQILKQQRRKTPIIK